MTLGLTRNVFWINRYCQGRGDPTIRNLRLQVGPSPILWNQSGLPKELVGPLNLLVLLLSRQSSPFTLPPSHSFVLISSNAKEGLSLSRFHYPCTTAEGFSCRRGSFIIVSTHKRAQANRPITPRPEFHFIVPLLHNYYPARDTFNCIFGHIQG